MSFKQKITRMLDRPGGRGLLSLGASTYAKKLTNDSAKIFYDEIWMHHIDGYYFPDKKNFDYYKNRITNWRADLETRFKNTKDYWFFCYEPKKGDVIVDVGVGIGEDLYVLTDAVGGAGRIIAVEAHPNTFLKVQKLCQWNNYTNVKLCKNAIVDRPCTLQIGDIDEHISNSVVVQNHDLRQFTVQGVTLDSLCKDEQISHINFLKMNIEGAEKYAIYGMEGIIQHTHHVCISCHDFRADRGDGEEFRSRDVVLEFLKDNGFEIILRKDDHRDYVRDQINGVNRKIVPKTDK